MIRVPSYCSRSPHTHSSSLNCHCCYSTLVWQLPARDFPERLDLPGPLVFLE